MFFEAFVDEMEKIGKSKWVKMWEQGKLSMKSLSRVAGKEAEKVQGRPAPKKLPPEGGSFPKRALRQGLLQRLRRRGTGRMGRPWRAETITEARELGRVLPRKMGPK